MPRKARMRQTGAFYHVTCKSISEILLFRDDADKTKYLEFIDIAFKEMGFTVLSYSLMDNHVHLQINSNHADISKIMKKINVSYSIYYNRRYERKGPVFAGRFFSKIIEDEKHFLMVSLYIHNNAKDLPRYCGDPSSYPFSSSQFYLNPNLKSPDFLNKNIILKFFNNHLKNASREYKKLLSNYSQRDSKTHDCYDISEDETNIYLSEYEITNGFEYHSNKVLKVSYTPQELIQKACRYFRLEEHILLENKYLSNNTEEKGIIIVLLRSLIDLSRKDLCRLFKNMSISNIYRLSMIGISKLENPAHKNMIIDGILSN